MLMHARPSKSSTTRPPPIAVVRFRSMQHKQLEVWQRHCDCGAVDLPTASGISQESSVSVVRKNTKAHQRNSTREMGSKRKSSIESRRKISSPISIHQSIFSKISLGACWHRFDFSTLYELPNLPPPKGFVILSSKRQTKCAYRKVCRVTLIRQKDASIRKLSRVTGTSYRHLTIRDRR